MAVREQLARVLPGADDGARSLAGIYRDKGMQPDAARELADQIAEKPRTALDTLVREDLGIDPEELGGSAYGAAISSFCLFALGALFPVAPYLFLKGHEAFMVSIASTLAGLVLIGMGTALFT